MSSPQQLPVGAHIHAGSASPAITPPPSPGRLPAEERLVRRIQKRLPGHVLLSSDPSALRVVALEALAADCSSVSDAARVRANALTPLERRAVRTVTNRAAALRSRRRQRTQLSDLQRELAKKDKQLSVLQQALGTVQSVLQELTDKDRGVSIPKIGSPVRRLDFDDVRTEVAADSFGRLPEHGQWPVAQMGSGLGTNTTSDLITRSAPGTPRPRHTANSDVGVATSPMTPMKLEVRPSSGSMKIGSPARPIAYDVMFGNQSFPAGSNVVPQMQLMAAVVPTCAPDPPPSDVPMLEPSSVALGITSATLMSGQVHGSCDPEQDPDMALLGSAGFSFGFGKNIDDALAENPSDHSLNLSADGVTLSNTYPSDASCAVTEPDQLSRLLGI